MKRFLTLLIGMCMIVCMLAGCGTQGAEEDVGTTDDTQQAETTETEPQEEDAAEVEETGDTGETEKVVVRMVCLGTVFMLRERPPGRQPQKRGAPALL